MAASDALSQTTLRNIGSITQGSMWEDLLRQQGDASDRAPVHRAISESMHITSTKAPGQEVPHVEGSGRIRAETPSLSADVETKLSPDGEHWKATHGYITKKHHRKHARHHNA